MEQVQPDYDYACIRMYLIVFIYTLWGHPLQDGTSKLFYCTNLMTISKQDNTSLVDLCIDKRIISKGYHLPTTSMQCPSSHQEKLGKNYGTK